MSRPNGMRQVVTRRSPREVWEPASISTEVEFRTELGDVRVKWDGTTGRVKIYALGVPDVIDVIDVRPVGSNVVTIGLTGERID